MIGIGNVIPKYANISMWWFRMVKLLKLHRTPQMAQSEATSFPADVLGEMSP